MIIKNDTEQPLMNGISSTKEFTIKASSKAFSILSSGLYSNKIKAIIRELSCNAYDSHVAAGKKDIPFYVHIPTTLEPWFSVKDYGIGLDENQVNTIYTTYFESTKTNSNDYVGALGLGSKSPFCYTDNFTVTAIKDGIGNIFSAFLNQNGVPEIALMNTFQTQDPNGVEVKFGVFDSVDFIKFKNSALEVYFWFDTKPTSNVEIEIGGVNDLKTTLCEGFRLVKNSDYSGSTLGIAHPTILMGNVSYPIYYDSLKNFKEFKEYVNYFQHPIIIEAEIGEVDVQASREGLSYNSLTISTLKNKLEKLHSFLTTNVGDIIHDENKWIVAENISKLKTNRIWIDPIMSYLKVFPNEFVSKYSQYNSFHDITFNKIHIDRSKVESMNIDLAMFDKSSSIRYNINCSFWISLNISKIFINDTKSGAFATTLRWVKDQKLPGVFMLLSKIDKNKDMDLGSFMKLIHNPPESKIMKVSSIKTVLEPKQKKTTEIFYTLKTSTSYNESVTWSEPYTSFDDLNNDSKIKYYVPLNRFDSISEYYTDFKDVYGNIRYCSLFDRHNIYGLRKENLKKINNSWVKIDDHIIETLNKKWNDIIDYNVHNYLNSNRKYCVFKKITLKVNTNRNNGYNYANELVKIFLPEKYKELMDICDKTQKEIREFFEIYPLLEYANENAPERIVSEYINLINKQTKELSCSHT